MNEVESKAGRRLVLFPAPYQGHITPMLHLATALYSKGFAITIIQTRYNSLDPLNYPNFTFHSIDDGLSENSTLAPIDPMAILLALNANCEKPFRDCLSQILSQMPVFCLIYDPIWSFIGQVAQSFNLPRIMLRTGSMSSAVVYTYLDWFKERGYYPLQEARLDEPLEDFPPFKVRDLPLEIMHEVVTRVVQEFSTCQGVICNTFEELESNAISKARKNLPDIPFFPIGPLYKYSATSLAPSIWTQDEASISWLNTQAPKSVLYVSFGSLAEMCEDDFEEIAWGLAMSEQPFLWVVRRGLREGEKGRNLLPEGYLDMISGRGCIVEWAPQTKVLAHPSVGGFWTHCGWNSTLESICEGVPMLSFPCFVDQGMNGRQITDEWKIGLQLSNVNGVSRDEIRKGIRKLIVSEEGEEMRSRVTTLKDEAKLCLMEGGSSYKSLNTLASYLLSL